MSIPESLGFLPISLPSFLKNIITHNNSQLKIATLGQALTQASCPRNIQCPLQHALGVQLHSQYASHNLIETLHSMGLCCSFKSARDYEKCAAIIDGNTIHKSDNSFIQYVADNVDHNICTLDGHGTFH